MQHAELIDIPLAQVFVQRDGTASMSKQIYTHTHKYIAIDI